MHIIVGLGNHGSEYENTRHNVGFAVIDLLCKKWHLRLKRSSNFLYVTEKINNKEILLVKPQTYMNNSGLAVREVLLKFNVLPENLLIVADDFHLPLGKVRFRKKGSSGGHNGLASIIYSLNTNEFPRLRCGIGSETMPGYSETTADFVLSPFSPNERITLNKMIEGSRDSIMLMVDTDLETAISKYNNKQF
ncbi:MAG: aminoacyl-tRNA hydrolase [Ignavibacteriales bacterium]|nr:aminoacyl-tRNA hydrolase [Ignavibacteriales bacterium]